MWWIKKQPLFKEPFFLQWHITNQCGLSCRHCYIKKETSNEPSLSDLLCILNKYERFLKTIKREGRIHITGGEPFLSPHLFFLLAEAKKKDIHCRILSNGITTANEDIHRLASSGCHLVQISIEGDKSINNFIRGENSFEKAVETMKLLRIKRVEITVNMTVSKVNAGEIEKVMRIASQYADRFNISRLTPINNKNSINAKDVLSPSEIYGCFQKVYKYKRANPKLHIPLRDPLWHAFLRRPAARYTNGIHGCSAGYNGITVDYDGTIYPCRRLPIALGNILNLEFYDVWKDSSVLEKLRNRDSLKGECGKCKIRWSCGGCRAAAYAVKKDYLGEDLQCFHAAFH